MGERRQYDLLRNINCISTNVDRLIVQRLVNVADKLMVVSLGSQRWLIHQRTWIMNFKAASTWEEESEESLTRSVYKRTCQCDAPLTWVCSLT